MVVVKISETYDLNTVRNSVGLIGIHTPSSGMIGKMWPGFFQNYKFVRILKGDVRVACASYLPADPLQVGTETGKVAPQDMFNPILYRAVSNESFETILQQIYVTNRNMISGGSVGDHSPIYAHDPSDPDYPGVDQQWNIYYGLLGSPGWRKAMPQAGLQMFGLRPLVHTVLNSFGNLVNPPDSAGDLNLQRVQDRYGGFSSNSPVARTFRGRVVPMPKLPTRTGNTASGDSPRGDVTIPPVWVGVLVMPPSKLNTLYYRLKIDWYVEFSVPRSVQSNGSYEALASLGQGTYYSSYANTSKDMEVTTDSIDTVGAEVEKIMES